MDQIEKNSIPLVRLNVPRPLLYIIYQRVLSLGGVLELSSIGSFQSTVRKIIIENIMDTMDEINSDHIERIRLILFSIQFVTEHPEAEKKIYELGLVNFVGKE